MLDLDGVVYLGGTAIPGAAEALRKADAAGMRLAYVTNNAFRTPAAIAALLDDGPWTGRANHLLNGFLIALLLVQAVLHTTRLPRSTGAIRLRYAFDLANGNMMAFAGLWDAWKDPANG